MGIDAPPVVWNVPARRKFLKSARTELAHAWDVFHAVAIPGVLRLTQVQLARTVQEAALLRDPLAV